MSIAVKCPECGDSFAVDDAMAGRRGRCPKCGGVFRAGEQADENDSPEEGFSVEVDLHESGKKRRAGGKKKRKASSAEPSREGSPGVPISVWAAAAFVGAIFLAGGGYLIFAGGGDTTATSPKSDKTKRSDKQTTGDSTNDSDTKKTGDEGDEKPGNTKPKPVEMVVTPVEEPAIDFENDIVPAIARLVPYYQGKPIEGGTGSGFFINDKQWIVTNHHVVQYADAVKVMVAGSEKLYEVEGIVGKNTQQDIVIIKPKEVIPGVKRLTLAADGKVVNADRIFVVGNPYMNRFVTTRGVVTRKTSRTSVVTREELDLKPKLPTDAPQFTIVEYDARVFPGSDGSPVINRNGEVIAMHMSIFWFSMTRPPSIDVMPQFGIGIHAKHVASVVQRAGGSIEPFRGKGPPPPPKYEKDDSEKPPTIEGLAGKLKAEIVQLVARGWTANDEDEYQSLARIGKWITDAKELQEFPKIPQKDRDAVNDAANAAIAVIGKAVDDDIFSEIHIKRTNQQASKSSPKPGDGIFVFGQVFDVSDDEIAMQLIGKNQFILVPASKNIREVKKKSRWIVLGRFTNQMGLATNPETDETKLAPRLKVYALIDLK